MQSELQEAKDDLAEQAKRMDTRNAEIMMLSGKLVELEKQMKDKNDKSLRLKADWNALQEDYRKVSLFTFNIVLHSNQYNNVIL